MLSTKQKGDITEIECMLALKKRGFIVSMPYGEDTPYDLIVDVNGSLFRIQCKTSRVDSEGTFVINCRSNSRTIQDKGYKGSIDYFMTIFNGKAYLIPVEECGSTTKTLRLEKPSNNQSSFVCYAKNYELENIFMINKG